MGSGGGYHGSSSYYEKDFSEMSAVEQKRYLAQQEKAERARREYEKQYRKKQAIKFFVWLLIIAVGVLAVYILIKK